MSKITPNEPQVNGITLTDFRKKTSVITPTTNLVYAKEKFFLKGSCIL